MSPEIEKVIRKLDDIDVSNIMPFGTQHADILFPIAERAIVKWQGHYYLILPEQKNFNDEYKVLTELFSYLRYMENEHIIYVQPLITDVQVFLHKANDQKKTSVKEEYDLGNNCTLCISNNTPSINCTEANIAMSNVSDITVLTKEIEHYLQSYIYPTNGLHDFITRDFLSESDYQTQRSVKISRVSVAVAILIALFSPVATLLLSNNWGYVTITESQFDVIKTMKSAYTLKDTIKKINNDTSQSNFKIPFSWPTN